MSNAGRDGRIAKDRDARRLRRELLEQFNPFRAYAVLEGDKSGCIPPRPCQAADKPCADRIDDIGKNNRHAARDALQRRYALGGGGKDDVWRERDQFFGVAAAKIGVVPVEAYVKANIVLGPTELLQCLNLRPCHCVLGCSRHVAPPSPGAISPGSSFGPIPHK